MPRLARLDVPGVLHHVIIRGIEHRRIFLNDANRDEFVQEICDMDQRISPGGWGGLSRVLDMR